MIVVNDIFNECNYMVMSVCWYPNKADCLILHCHTQMMCYFDNSPSLFMEQFEKCEVLLESFHKSDDVIHILQSDYQILAYRTKIEYALHQTLFLHMHTKRGWARDKLQEHMVQPTPVCMDSVYVPEYTSQYMYPIHTY